MSLVFCAFSMATSLPGLHILHPTGQTPTGFHGRLGIYLPAALTGGSDREREGGVTIILHLGFHLELATATKTTALEMLFQRTVQGRPC